MAQKEGKPKGRRGPRKRGGYVPRSNAVHVTIYAPDGRPLPPKLADEAANTLMQFAFDNGLLIGTART